MARVANFLFGQIHIICKHSFKKYTRVSNISRYIILCTYIMYILLGMMGVFKTLPTFF